jgi:hypothetical protein
LCHQLKIVVFVKATTLWNPDRAERHAYGQPFLENIDLIFLYTGHSSKKCWSNSVALQGHASHTGLARNFILLSVVFRAIVLVLASIFKFDNWNSTILDKYGCLP